jgi:radical SAM superfamily enzyme YgiQ (UPF0313 family)
MHVLFVHAASPGVPFNSSIAALSAWVKQHGHSTALLRVRREATQAAVMGMAGGSGADVIALSFMTCQLPQVAKLLPWVRAALPGVPVIVGGAHPTTWPQETLVSLPVDVVCTGEGEEPLLAWLSDPGARVPGLMRRDSSEGPSRGTVADVDSLPDWDRALFGPVLNSGNRYERAVGVALSRGFCPFTCTFCGIDGYRRLHGQPTSGAMRMRSVQRCISEISAVPDGLVGQAGFATWDAIFPLERRWVKDFCEAYGGSIGRPLAVQLRVEQVTPSLVASLATAGCDYAVLGVECGDEGYRRRILDKPFSNAACGEAVVRLQEAGIAVHASFMLGMPFETKRHLAATVRFARSLGAAELSWKYYTPERWTRLHGLCEKHDLLLPGRTDVAFGDGTAMIRMTRCTQHDLDVTQRALGLIRGPIPTDSAPSAAPPVELRR